jgi:hypothetical protein
MTCLTFGLEASSFIPETRNLESPTVLAVQHPCNRQYVIFVYKHVNGILVSIVPANVVVIV